VRALRCARVKTQKRVAWVGKRGVQGACGVLVVSVRLAFFTWRSPAGVVLLSPPKPDFASKRPGAQKYPAPSGALLSKRREVASSSWRTTERPLFRLTEL
jgi:hypothetical protein